MVKKLDRRSFLKRTAAASAAAAVGLTLEEKILLAAQDKKSPTAKVKTKPDSKAMPTGKIGHVTLSRLIVGGNLINGVAHARDLMYVSPLIKHYFTDERIMDTWQRAEENGINTMSTWPSDKALRAIKRYRKERGGKIQWLGHVNINKGYGSVKRCIDNGAVGIYIAGDNSDRYVKEGRVDELGKALSFIKQNGLVAGISGHPVDVPLACELAQIDADFYMKTLHHTNYWSATPKQDRKYDVRIGDPTFELGIDSSGIYHDNIWCINPEYTIEYMAEVEKPWMAFKVLAAGAIDPEDGFKYAFENGADFIHVGMFDFQVEEDAAILKNILSSNLNRTRPWRG